jgi:hypothetical protein
VIGNRADEVRALGRREEAEKKNSDAKKLILGDAEIPLWFTTTRVTNLMAVASSSIVSTEIKLYIPEADRDEFWLSAILGGMVSAYLIGTVGRRCAADGCNQFFIPSPRRPDQQYHSTKCQNRMFMRNARSGQQ